MSLLYECGAGLVPAYFARASFGMDAYLFSSGPSLSKLDLSMFNGKPVYKVGINTTYPKIKPDLWVGMDYPKCFNSELWSEPIPKILRNSHNRHSVGSTPVRDFPMVYFAEAEEVEQPWREVFMRRSHQTKFIWTNNTFTTTLHILIWMGFKRIHLIGSDFGSTEEDYFDDSINARPFNHDETSGEGSICQKQRELNRRLYLQQLKFLRNFNRECEQRDIEIISCSYHSPVNVFLTYVDPLVALESSQSRQDQKVKVNF
jgi:hypothetical protein